ncbi:alpha/beta fold hydrolase [Kitasatospora gansuensis]
MPPRRPGPVAVLPLRRASRGGHTVHLVHPGALAAQVYRTLADALPEGVGLTVLDLSASPEYGEAALTGGRADTTVEALADWLAAELTDRQLSLVGWSFGGVVAQSMVERLPADRRPERLVLLDSIAPTEEYQQPDEALEPPLLLGWFAMYLGAKRGRPVPLDPAALAAAASTTGSRSSWTPPPRAVHCSRTPRCPASASSTTPMSTGCCATTDSPRRTGRSRRASRWSW